MRQHVHAHPHLRRPRARRGEGGALRDEILAATESLLLRTGDEAAVSIRSIAQAVGCTSPSIYMHFADKTELLFAVCERHFRALDQEVAEAATASADPVECVKLGLRAYVRFGLRNPEQYRILFMRRHESLGERFPVERLQGASAFQRLLDAVQRCIDAGKFTVTDPMLVATGLWTAAHGLVSLLLAKPDFPWPPTEQIITHCIDAHVTGLLCGSDG